MMTDDAVLNHFERGEVDPSSFSHRMHVQVAHALLLRHSFAEALPRMARGVRSVAIQAGKPEKYNETMTTAFLSLVADCLIRNRDESFAHFADAHPARLTSAEARGTFLLPDRLQVAERLTQPDQD